MFYTTIIETLHYRIPLKWIQTNFVGLFDKLQRRPSFYGILTSRLARLLAPVGWDESGRQGCPDWRPRISPHDGAEKSEGNAPGEGEIGDRHGGGKGNRQNRHLCGTAAGRNRRYGCDPGETAARGWYYRHRSVLRRGWLFFDPDLFSFKPSRPPRPLLPPHLSRGLLFVLSLPLIKIYSLTKK